MITQPYHLSRYMKILVWCVFVLFKWNFDSVVEQSEKQGLITKESVPRCKIQIQRGDQEKNVGISDLEQLSYDIWLSPHHLLAGYLGGIRNPTPIAFQWGLDV